VINETGTLETQINFKIFKKNSPLAFTSVSLSIVFTPCNAHTSDRSLAFSLPSVPLPRFADPVLEASVLAAHLAHRVVALVVGGAHSRGAEPRPGALRANHRAAALLKLLREHVLAEVTAPSAVPASETASTMAESTADSTLMTESTAESTLTAKSTLTESTYSTVADATAARSAGAAPEGALVAKRAVVAAQLPEGLPKAASR